MAPDAICKTGFFNISSLVGGYEEEVTYLKGSTQCCLTGSSPGWNQVVLEDDVMKETNAYL